MEILSIKNLSFTYPMLNTRALDSVTMTVEQGDFVVLCGQSGSGKTTLLKMFKREITPNGKCSGEVFFKGEPIKDIDDRTSAKKIGFVFQKPEQQIVTDKVWHELAFGLESLGYDSKYIRLRVGEMANYFGISSLFHRKTENLSGGQKQLLNLASVMAMSPDVLILDEPTSQLDPISAGDFIATLKRLNTELGLTIILTEHRLQDVFPIADKVAVLDNGKLIAYGKPREICRELKKHPVSAGFPSAVQIYNSTDISTDCPLTVREGRDFINNNFSKRKIEIRDTVPKTEIAVELKDAFFRYEKEGQDILAGTRLKVYKGEHFSILGGNGSGKTTTLKILSGILKPYRGSVFINGQKMNRKPLTEYSRMGIAMLPQNPETVFIKPKIIEDYIELCKIKGVENRDKKIAEITESLGIKGLMDKHPYDLSGGEVQRCALGKILLANPSIILLDEPTKGIDAYGKISLAKMLNKIKSQGRTIITVTHDVEFSAIVSDRCALFFDGDVLSNSVPQEFFSTNNFYTTSVSRICRDRFINAVTVDDAVSLIKEGGQYENKNN